MTQEDKELLLKDICARLPYGVKVNWNDNIYYFNGIYSFNVCVLSVDNKDNVFTTAENDYIKSYLTVGINIIKPYLFPLSSMTEEQKEEYHYIVNYICPDDTENWAEGEFIYVNQMEQLLHFYHINHLDYRGLIPMDLAIDATGKNIY